MKITLLGIQLTKKCNAECEICCFSCSPRNNEKIDIKIAARAIEQAAKINSINTIGFSGGEPFLFVEDLAELIKLANSLNLRTTCTTNGFWGKTEQAAFNTIRYLKSIGLNKISLSTDQYHNEFVPIENIKNILDAGKKLDFPMDIGCVVTKNSKRIGDIAKDIGDSLISTYIIEGPCLPIGNAANKIPKDEYIYINSEPKSKCSMLNSLVVMCDGSAYPCCSQGGETDPLLLGNINEDSVEQLIKNFNKNMYCRTLSKEGVSWFLNTLKSEGIDLFEPNKYVSQCDICNKLFTNRDYINIFNSSLEKEKNKIYEKFIQSIPTV